MSLLLGAGSLSCARAPRLKARVKRMIDDDEGSGHAELEFDDGRATGGNHRGLHVVGRRAHVAFGPDRVKNLSDDVEGRGHVRAAVADEQAHRLADLGGQGVIAGGRADGTVEHDIFGPLLDRLDHAEGLQALLAIGALGVEVALHDVVLVVDLCQPFLRLDQDQAIHAIGDMHGDRRRGAVIDEKARIDRLERKDRAMAGRSQRCGGAAAGAVDGVQVDIVRHLVVGMIFQMHFDQVALAHPDEFAGTLPRRI